MLLVQIGFSGGTGCLLKINSYRFILTCSHVVFTVVRQLKCGKRLLISNVLWCNFQPSNCQITCYYNKGSFTSDLIYKNPNFAQAYDIALLSVPDNIPDAFFTRCDPNPASVGKEIQFWLLTFLSKRNIRLFKVILSTPRDFRISSRWQSKRSHRASSRDVSPKSIVVWSSLMPVFKPVFFLLLLKRYLAFYTPSMA